MSSPAYRLLPLALARSIFAFRAATGTVPIAVLFAGVVATAIAVGLSSTFLGWEGINERKVFLATGAASVGSSEYSVAARWRCGLGINQATLREPHHAPRPQPHNLTTSGTPFLLLGMAVMR